MENTTRSEQAVDVAGERGAEFCSGEESSGAPGSLQQQRVVASSAKCEVKRTVRSLVERFGLSREDLVSAYDECVLEGDGREVRVERNDAAPSAAPAFTGVIVVAGGEGEELHEKQTRRLAKRFPPPLENGEMRTVFAPEQSGRVRVNGASSTNEHSPCGVSGSAMEVEEEGDEGEGQTQREEARDGEAENSRRGERETWNGSNSSSGEESRRLESVSECSPLEEKEEVDKMQTLVQSALRVYEASSMQPEIGQKRRGYFSLEDELTLQPSTFVQELLDRDQTMVAQAIKKYMNQYSVPQREVVEKTGLNQSHLSQHFLHGVTMKRSKRVKLYHWFEDDQKIRTGKPSTADSALNSVLESPKVEGNRRRPRWKWSPISTQILSEAFKKNHFPTREQRVELAKLCNEAELTMNNGSPIRGPEGDTEGITEQRVNTWFTNRRKGLSTPSPTRGGLAMGHSSAIFTHGLPTLLRAATPTTPTQSYSHTSEVEWNEDKPGTPTPVQALVSHVQQVQTATSAGSAVQLAGTSTATALPLTAITLPGASGTVLAPGVSLAAMSQSTAAPPLQTFAITPEGIPAALIPPSQFQAILSQVHVSSESGLPQQIQLANTSGGIFTIPMLHPQKVTAAAIAPSQLQTYTVTPSSMMAKSLAGREILMPSSTSPLSSTPSPSTYHSPTLTALPTFTQSQAPVQASVPTIIGSNQVQALLASLQAQAKLQGLPYVHFSPANSLPLTITLPGSSSDDIVRAQALLVNQGPSD